MAADDKTTKKKTSSKTAAKKSAAKKVAPTKKVATQKKDSNKTSAKKSAAVKKAPAKPPSKSATKKSASSKKVATSNTTDKPKTQAAKKGQTVEQEQLVAAPINNSLVRGKFKPYVPTADEEYMNTTQRDHFKLILKDWKAELMHEVDRTVHHMKDESANLPDPADRATQEEEFSLELRTRDRERKLIKKIDKTLERIEHDDYGFCDGCGVEVGLRRLEARPTASLCIDCKTLAEIKERQYRT